MSDEVTNFLRSVEQLKDRRDSEDEARSRELEQKILQERRERQARREERARSISPQKSSPANTPPPSSHRYTSSQASDGLALASSPVLGSPSSSRYPSDQNYEDPSKKPDLMESISSTKENEAPLDFDSKRSSTAALGSSNGSPLARTPTLSWQRRPTSQASERPKSRPLSVVATENAAVRSSGTSADPSDLDSSRDQIAQSLGSKDPAWFRQTAERGVASAAYCRNQVEDEDRLDMSSVRSQLPGMARSPPEEASKKPAKEPAIEPHSSMLRTTPGIGALKSSPMPLMADQKLDPPLPKESTESATSNPDSEGLTSSPSGRSSPNRPRSPTKGMGGFVQSAMMKRSDSVKRWSVTSPPSLQRADTVALNRTAPLQGNAHSRSGSLVKDSTSRPTSSQGKDQASPSPESGTADEKLVSGETKHDDEDETPLPISPSRTMDPRRWSPTKGSSWLDAALNKPESPKAKPTPPISTQPAWMLELNKAKASRANLDPNSSQSTTRKHEVKTGGLLRSSPMGAGVKPTGLGISNSPLTSPVATGPKPSTTNFRSSLTRRVPDTSGTGPGADEEKTDDLVTAASPPGSKPKPETPPKKDFRANLKPRQPPPTAGKDETPEFRNVFGTLRRTTTQNYVAPDELKGNILKGKAALNVTGGPKRSERKDEFKEAILAKKSEFQKVQQEGRGVTKSTASGSEKPIPEGLTKVLKPSKTGQKDASTSNAPLDTPAQQPAPARASTMSTVSRPKEVVKEAEEPVQMEPLHKEMSAPGRMQGKPGGGGLANRFNPGLAGLLARGPPPMASGGSRDNEASTNRNGASAGNIADRATNAGPQLTHMTKNRARGPRRKAPSSTVQSAQQDEEKSLPGPQTTPKATISPKPKEMASFQPNKPRSLPEPTAPLKPQVSPKPQSLAFATDSNKSAPELGLTSGGTAAHPLVSSFKNIREESTVKNSPVLAQLSSKPAPPIVPSTKIHEQAAAQAASSEPSKVQAKDETAAEAVAQPPSPRKLDLKRMSRFLDESKQKDETDRTRSPSPPKSYTRPLPELATIAAAKRPIGDKGNLETVVSTRTGATMFGNSVSAAKPRPAPLEGASKAYNPVKSPIEGSSGSVTTAFNVALQSPPISSPARSPTKYASEVSNIMNDIFGEERPERTYRVDAAELLMMRPQVGPRVQTQKSRLFQISGDGHQIPVASHYERVLFEREMYLCFHTFKTENGKNFTGVYFWAGDEVPQSAAEDAQIFAQREAKSAGGKLVKLTQGKETPEFLQALGGIVIIRRGSSNKYDSLAPNMLCGRRYLGEVVFDEVDFSPVNLCSGFPCLITFQGKCYLWKGKGSDVDELSCARLIGMDLALMGELFEVEDGNEPADFWNIFDGGKRSPSADHWRLKPNYDKYSGRLFCSDADSRQQIYEIHPFSQADMQSTGIYVLDAFFELYIIVGGQQQGPGRRPGSRYVSFHNALDFAQEYAILSAGIEDRPFVPISTVVLEGVPRDMRSVFRKWRDDAGPTRSTAAPAATPNLRRGRSLRIMPLGQALKALTE